MPEFDPGVLVWWIGLSLVGLVNVALWLRSAREVLGRPATTELDRYRRRQLLLSGLFVLGCASRSWIIRADVQRLAMIDSWIASVLVGRSIATVAELSFVTQWALLLGLLGRRLDGRLARGLAWAIVPTIVVAETCSWTAVLTTNYLGNTFEESLWTVTATLLCVGLASLLPRAGPELRRFLAAGLVLGCGYVLFMCTVDVPMYYTRWRADEAAGRVYLSAGEGVHDALRVVASGRWDDWREEIAWMSLYFSAAVWMSLALISRPRWPEEAD